MHTKMVGVQPLLQERAHNGKSNKPKRAEKALYGLYENDSPKRQYPVRIVITQKIALITQRRWRNTLFWLVVTLWERYWD